METSCQEEDVETRAATVQVGSGERFSVLPGRETRLTARLTLVETSDRAVRRWGPETRGCLDDERDFDGGGGGGGGGRGGYSAEACTARCRARLALSVCACAPWHLSRVVLKGAGEEVPICTGPKVCNTVGFKNLKLESKF